jgi:hypothetical protein
MALFFWISCQFGIFSLCIFLVVYKLMYSWKQLKPSNYVYHQQQNRKSHSSQ